MQFAERTEYILRPHLNGAGAAGVKPRWSSGYDLRRLDGRTRCRERGQRIGLGIEGGVFAVAAVPETAGAGRPRQPVSQSRGSDELVFWPVAPENLPDLEQSGIRHAAIGVALNCGDQTRKEAWPHVGQV